MSAKPYIPFYKPIGMSNEEYEYEVRIAEEKYVQWEYEQRLEQEIEETIWKESPNKGTE